MDLFFLSSPWLLKSTLSGHTAFIVTLKIILELGHYSPLKAMKPTGGRLHGNK